MTEYDVVVVGAGPNGLAAAVALARSGLSVLVLEQAQAPGGGARTLELTLPGFRHDVCSAVHPLGLASPFFRSLELERHGLSWVQPNAALAHVLPDGSAVTLERSLRATTEQLGRDRAAYERLFAPLVTDFDHWLDVILGPLRLFEHPLSYLRFGRRGMLSLEGLCRRHFRDPTTRALLAGIAAHAMLPLSKAGTAAFGLVLAAAGHAVGWPIARGGSSAITEALIGCLRHHGGRVRVGHLVRGRGDLPRARAYLFDVTPRQLLAILGDELPRGYAARLRRFRYGPGVYKLDWALSQPIPWRDPRCARAATVHIGGSLHDVAVAEFSVNSGRPALEPFVLLVQPTLFDPTRTPTGTHAAWAYCHVPHGSEWDARLAIEAQVERHAPGFRDVILARATKSAVAMERYNPNYVGGDINGGAADLFQLYFRPVARLDPYSTPVRDVFLCSSSTPPGGGVHGMCGYWAAESVARRVFGHSLRALRPVAEQTPAVLQSLTGPQSR